MMETPEIFAINCEEQKEEYNNLPNHDKHPLFKCNKCDKHYTRKYSLKRHIDSKHKIKDVLKLMLHNENLRLQMKLYCDQIKFLKRLILIQDLTLRAHGMKNIEMNKKSTDNSNNPLTKLEHYNNDNYTAKDIERLHLT